MAGPWEDYGGTSEVSGPWDDYKPDISLVKKAPAQAPQVEEPNVARERVSIGGEFVGGIKDFFGDITGANTPKEAGTVEDILHRLRSPLGLVRAAASPLAPLTNLASGAGEKVSDITPDVSLPGGLNLKDVTGGLTQSIIDVVGPTAISKLSKAAAPAIQRAKPLKSEKIAEIQNKVPVEKAAVEEVAEQQRAQFVKPGAEDVRSKFAADAPKTEDVGRKFIDETFPQERQRTRDIFEEQYLSLKSPKPADTANYLTKANEILGEETVTQILKSKAEKTAGKVKTVLEAEDEAVEELQKFFSDPSAPDAQKAIAAFKEQNNLLGKTEVTIDDLVREQKRLGGAGRAAFKSGNRNLARQFEELQRGVEADIAKADPDLFKSLQATDEAYRKEFIARFGPQAPIEKAGRGSAESVVDQLIPKASDKNRVDKITQTMKTITDPEERLNLRKSWVNVGVEKAAAGEDFGKGLVRYWDTYADPAKTGNKVLREVLGEQYNDFRDVVQVLRTREPKSITQAVKDAVIQGEPAIPQSLKDVEFIRRTKIKQIEKQALEQIEALTGNKKAANLADRIKNYGMFLMVEGGVSATVGSPTGTLRALAGGLMIMTPGIIAKLIRLPTGLQLFRRGVRAVPGTSQAAATARQIQNFLQKEEQEQQGR